MWHDSCIPVTILIHTIWLIYTWDMTHTFVMWQYSYIRVTWLMCTCDVTYVYVWYDSCVTCDVTRVYMWQYSYIQHDSNTRETWLMHMTCDSHMYSYIRLTWRMYMCDMTRIHMWHDPQDGKGVTIRSQHCYCVWHDSCIRVTWLLYTCDMTHRTAKVLRYEASAATASTLQKTWKRHGHSEPSSPAH